MPSSQTTISLPDGIQGKTGVIIAFIIVIILIWMSNTGRLIPFIALFEQAGANLKNGITSGTGNIQSLSTSSAAGTTNTTTTLAPIKIGNTGSNAPTVIGTGTVNGATIPVTTPLPGYTPVTQSPITVTPLPGW